MTDQFQKVAKKRERVSKRARDPVSGQFEDVDPRNDPDLLDQCTRWVRAAEEMVPLLRALARTQGDSEEQRFTRVGAKFLSEFLLAFRGTLLDQLSVDPEMLREAKKPRVTTARQRLFDETLKRGSP